MQAFIGSSVVLGMTVGAVSGGLIMKIGRRKALIMASAYGIAGNLLTYHLNIYFLVAGRFLFGFSVGIFSSVCPRYMEETIPAHLYDTLAIIYNTSQSTGSVVAYFFGELIPANDDTPALIADDNWLIIYVYFPVAMNLVVILAFVFLIRQDAVKFLIGNDKQEEAQLAIKEVYKHAKTPEL